MLFLDTAGHVLWDSSNGGTSYDQANYALFDSRDSSIIMTGNGNSTDYLETDQHGEGDMLTIKTDRNGKVIWHKSVGGHSEDAGYSIISQGSGNYLLFGSMHPYPDTTTGEIGGADNWLFVLDSAGNTITEKIFGGIAYEAPYSIVPYLNGYVALGSSYSTAFTEGTTYGRFSEYNSAFISYLEYWKLQTHYITEQKESLKVYPNPTDGIVTIITPLSENGVLTIFNILGTMVNKFEFNNNNIYNVNTKVWPKGLYIVQWKNKEGEIVTEKLMVE